MKKSYVLSLVLTLVLFVFPSVAFADEGESFYSEIKINVSLNEDGSADVVEHWSGYFYEGTEHYVKKENLQGAEVTDIQVSEAGVDYSLLDPWDLGAGLEEKTGRYGLVPTEAGFEIAWGVGEYGPHEYTLTYRIEDFILQLKDAQVIHWEFLNDGIAIPRAQVQIEIESFEALTEDDHQVWGFGHDGFVNFQQGRAVLNSSSTLFADDYVLILLRFDDGTFKAERKKNQSFKSFQKEVMQSSEYKPVRLGFFDSFFGSLIKAVLQFIGIILLFVAAIFILSRFNKEGNFHVQSPLKFSRHYLEEYYRDYPYQGDYLHAYFMVYRMGAANFDSLLTSLLLKWLYEDKIQMSEDRVGMLRRTQQTVHFLQDHHAPHSLEGELYKMLQDTSKNNLLTDRDISRWAGRQARQLRVWERKLLRESAEKLAELGLTKKFEKKHMFTKQIHYQFTGEGKQVLGNIYRYINYLHDFSLLHEHEAINVRLWDEIMIWAAYLNLTTVVMEQFKRMYPNYGIESKYDERSVRRSREMAALAAERRSRELRRQAEERARDAGRGGRTSQSGGGDAGGSSSGGGLR